MKVGKVSRVFRIILPIGILCGVLFGGATLVSAKTSLTEDELNLYSQNNITFYEPCSIASGGGSGGECGINVTGKTIEEKIWSGLTSFMTPEQAAGVMGNMSHEGGFNPARHETSFINSSPNFAITTNTSDSYGIGLIQWSFGRRVNLLKYIEEKAHDLLDRYIDAGRDTYGRISGKDFLEKAGDDATNQLIMLELCFLKQELESNSSYGGVLETTSIEEASDYFLEHVEIPANIPGQRPIRRADANKYYNEFNGKTISGSADGSSKNDPACNSCAQGSMNINGAAVCLAWPLGTEDSVYDWPNGSPNEKFKEVYEKIFPGRAQGSKCQDKGASCDVFTSTVVRWAYDKDFPRWVAIDEGTSDNFQYWYAKSHPDLWEVIDWNGDKSMVQAGDVLLVYDPGGHSFIAVQDEKGDMYVAEAGYCGFYGRIDEWRSHHKRVRNYILRPTKAKNSTNGVSVKDGVKSSSTTGSFSSGKTQGNHDIGASARMFAWPEDNFENHIRPESKDAWYEMVKDNLGHYPNDYVEEGGSCVIYVWGVLRFSGLIENFKISERLDEQLEAEPDWTKVQEGSVSEDALEDGDVLIHRCGRNGSGSYPCHYGLYVKGTDGVGYTLQASNPASANSANKLYRFPWTTKGLDGDWQEAWRNSKNKHGGSCDLCDPESEEDPSSMQLKAGGMNLSEAKEFMKAYRDAAMGKYYKVHNSIDFQGAHIHDADCPYGVMNNCVAFSQWFINKYTTVGPKWNSTSNGVDLVKKLASTANLKTGNQPRPYAIFSNAQFSYAGHTGVILGVDEAAKKVVVGEASCSESAGYLYYEPQAKEYSFDYIKSNNWTYAYTDDVISMGGQLKNA